MPKPLLVLIHLRLDGREGEREGGREREPEHRFLITLSVLYWDGAVEVPSVEGKPKSGDFPTLPLGYPQNSVKIVTSCLPGIGKEAQT